MYGTLRQNSPGKIHPLLCGHCKYIGPALLPGALYEVAAYPGAVLSPASSREIIHGELYQLTDNPSALFDSLDEYEECSASFPAPHEYQRCEVMVTLPTKQCATAWAYLYNQPVDGLEIIKGGDYSNFLARQKPE